MTPHRPAGCHLIRSIVPALMLLFLLADDIQAQRRGGGLSRGRGASSVRQSRSRVHRPARTRERTPIDRADTRTKPAARDRAARPPSSVRQSRAARARPAHGRGRTDTIPEHPRRGERFKELREKIKLYVDGKRYYYNRGYFYDKVYVSGDAYYEVVVAPVGAMVNEIPDDCEELEIDGLLYFDCAEVWFREVEVDRRTRYMVVEPPI